MAMSVEENKAIVRRYIEVGWSTGDMSAVEEAVAPDYPPAPAQHGHAGRE